MHIDRHGSLHQIEQPPLLALAPMEGITDFPCRLWCFLASGPDYLSTPFFRVTDGNPPKQLPHSFCPELFDPEWHEIIPYKVVPQLMAKRAIDFIKVAALILRQAEFVDLNCGCPSPTVVGHGAGSSLLQAVDQFSQFIQDISRELGAERISVKMRTGFASDIDFRFLLEGIASLPLKRVTVHGRTRFAAYTGTADWQLIDLASKILTAPVVGSGDITDFSSWSKIRNQSQQLSGYLIGRGALRNPWIFSELRSEQEVELSFECLKYALASFTLLHDLFQKDSSRLAHICRDRLQVLGTHAEAWREFYFALLDGLSYSVSQGFEVATSRWGFSRTKLLWNYMRSSLPDEFFSPKLFRASSMRDFFLGLDELHKQLQKTGNLALSLRYQAKHDWIYAGHARQD